MLLTLLLANLRYRWLPNLLTLVLFAVGIALMVLILLVSQQISAQRTQNIANIDVVVGAKGSPLQIVLSSIFQLETPTGNIPYAEAQKWARHPTVAQAVPLSMGDSYQGFRIVGTDSNYLKLYQAEFQRGEMWKGAGEVVIGATVAKQLKLQIGSTFEGAHGLADSVLAHEGEHIYKVVGILKAQGTVPDRLILTSLQSVWEVHEQPENDTSAQITALLLSFKGAMGMMQVPKLIQQNTALQVANPAQEWLRLETLLGSSTAIFERLAMGMLVLAAFSMLVSFLYGFKERQQEIALMRVMGANKRLMAAMLVAEALALSLLGYGLGIMAGHLLMAYVGASLEAAYHYPFQAWIWLPEEGGLLLPVLLMGLLGVLLPLILSYRRDISGILQEN